MQTNRNLNIRGRRQRVLVATIIAVTLLLAAQAAQAKEIVIDNMSAAYNPESVLVVDSSGVLYGTSVGDGGADNGTIFSLTPPAKGQTSWTETILYYFQGGSNDGLFPLAGLTPDGSGGFFGTTEYGGNGGCTLNPNFPQCGVVYHLAPPAQGQTNWNETVIHFFQGSDGANPSAQLIRDSATGVLFGTTYAGGASNAGTVFSLTPPAQGQTNWTETVLYSFTGAADGGFPLGHLTVDASGAFYSTTYAGGAGGSGTVFKLTPPSGGKTEWTETVLYSFLGWQYADGGNPTASVIFDASGNLYGTTSAGTGKGGFLNDGTVFELSPPSGGQTSWTETTLYSFDGEKDGAVPSADVIMDAQGALYSITSTGGKANYGTVFKLTPPGNGQTNWTEKLLVSFNGTDGAYSYYALTPVKEGKNVVLFGTASSGGSNNRGVVYEITGSGFAP